MADELVVRFTTITGAPLTPVVMHTTNQRGFAFFSEWRSVGPGELAIRYPKEQPFGLSVLYEIPGFGRVMTKADNQAKLYRLGGPPVDFRVEAATSKMAAIGARARDMTVPAELEERIRLAERDLATALRTPQGPERERALGRNLCAAYRLGHPAEGSPPVVVDPSRASGLDEEAQLPVAQGGDLPAGV